MTTTTANPKRPATLTKATSKRRCVVTEIASAMPVLSNDRIDTESGVIRGVKVLGLESRNTGKVLGLDETYFGDAVNKPYGYPVETMKSALPMFEGVAVCIDHPQFDYKPSGERIVVGGERKVTDRFGRLVNVRVTEHGTFADLEYVKSHPLASMVVEFAQRMPEAIALSINAFAHWGLQNGKIVCEQILDVRSVDIVGEKPGTTKGFFESEATPMDMYNETATAENTEENYVDPLYAPDNAEDAGELLKQGFEATVLSILKDESLTLDDKKSRIASLLDTQKQAADAVSGGEAAEDANSDAAGGEESGVGGGGDAGGGAAAETVAKAKPPQADRSAIILECVDLLQSKGKPAHRPIVEAMAALPTPEKRLAFVESLATIPGTPTMTPRSQSPAKPVTETAKPTTPKPDFSKPGSLASRLRGVG